MGLFGKTPEEEVMDLFGTFMLKDSDCSEAQFRAALHEHCYRSPLGLVAKPEAGVSGLGTRIDLYFQHRDVDFIVTIKKELSEQKAKILLGEAVILATCWAPRPPCQRTFLFVVIFGNVNSKVAGCVEPLVTGLNSLQKVSARFGADLIFFEDEEKRSFRRPMAQT